MFTYVHMDNIQLNLTEHSERHLPYFMTTGSMNHARFGANEKSKGRCQYTDIVCVSIIDYLWTHWQQIHTNFTKCLHRVEFSMRIAISLGRSGRRATNNSNTEICRFKRQKTSSSKTYLFVPTCNNLHNTSNKSSTKID
jgi:hypothetical protein